MSQDCPIGSAHHRNRECPIFEPERDLNSFALKEERIATLQLFLFVGLCSFVFVSFAFCSAEAIIFRLFHETASVQQKRGNSVIRTSFCAPRPGYSDTAQQEGTAGIVGGGGQNLLGDRNS